MRKIIIATIAAATMAGGAMAATPEQVARENARRAGIAHAQEANQLARQKGYEDRAEQQRNAADNARAKEAHLDARYANIARADAEQQRQNAQDNAEARAQHERARQAGIRHAEEARRLAESKRR